MEETAYEHRVRDAIHGFIHFSERERQLIDTPEFQRLRRIKQLAFTNYVYPGAMHTRFEHSLGVMELASRAFDQIRKKEPDLLRDNFNKIDLTWQGAKDLLRMAALLHDIGHLPFSHGAEVILPKGKKHEDMSISIIEYLEESIDSLMFSGASKIIIQLIQKGQVIPELTILKKILSGQIDADRMDYLLRDSHHCGVDYGRFDVNRLLETLLAVPGQHGALDLAISRGGVQALEALILARYYMFAQVYFHRTRRIYDVYLGNYLLSWGKKRFKSFLDVLKYDDYTIMGDIRKYSAADKQKQDIVQWAWRIYERKNHSSILDTTNFASANQRQGISRIHQELTQVYKDYDFILDLGANGSIHKFYVPGENEMAEMFRVISSAGDRIITEESRIIKQMPKDFHVVRLYVDCSAKNALEEIRRHARELSKEIKE